MRIGDTVKVAQFGENEFTLDPSGEIDGTISDIRPLIFDGQSIDFAFITLSFAGHVMAVPVAQLVATPAKASKEWGDK